ncbi:MAG: hypothetical protein ABW186_01190 [Rhodanobacteraceae bacterium]
MSTGFSFDSLLSRSNGAGERIADAATHLGDVLRDAGVTVSRRATKGATYARALGDDALTSGRDAARSARAVVEGRPLEAVLVVGLAAFALGWILRRVQEATSRDEEETTPPTRRRTTRAAPRRRANV